MICRLSIILIFLSGISSPTAEAVQCLRTLDFSLVIDNAGAFSDSDWTEMQRFSCEVVKRYAIGTNCTRVTLISHSGRVALNSDEGVCQTVNNLTHMETAKPLNGLLAELELRDGDRDAVPNLAVVVRYLGEDTPQEHLTSAFSRLHDRDIRLLVVGVGPKASEDTSIRTLISLLKDNSTHYYWASDTFGGLGGLVDDITRRSCVEGRTICTTGCRSNSLDVCLLVDSSGSITPEYWPVVLNFTASIAQQFKIGKDATQIGVITFSSLAYLEVKLNDSDTIEVLVEAIKNLKFLDAATNIQGAFNMANRVFFQPENGDRETSNNVIIMITDGKSSPRWDPIPEADKFKSNPDSRIYVIGVTNHTSASELSKISSAPHIEGVTWWHASAFENLKNYLDDLITSTCIRTCRPAHNAVCLDSKAEASTIVVPSKFAEARVQGRSSVETSHVILIVMGAVVMLLVVVITVLILVLPLPVVDDGEHVYING